MSLTYSNVLNINKKNYNGVTIEEKALSGKINIRGKSSDKEFMKNIGSVLNLVLPICLLYTSPSPRDQLTSRMPSSA